MPRSSRDGGARCTECRVLSPIRHRLSLAGRICRACALEDVSSLAPSPSVFARISSLSPSPPSLFPSSPCLSRSMCFCSGNGGRLVPGDSPESSTLHGCRRPEPLGRSAGPACRTAHLDLSSPLPCALAERCARFGSQPTSSACRTCSCTSTSGREAVTVVGPKSARARTSTHLPSPMHSARAPPPASERRDAGTLMHSLSHAFGEGPVCMRGAKPLLAVPASRWLQWP